MHGMWWVVSEWWDQIKGQDQQCVLYCFFQLPEGVFTSWHQHLNPTYFTSVMCQASWNHCGSISTGQTPALYLAMVQADGEPEEENLHLGTNPDILGRKKEWKEKAGGKQIDKHVSTVCSPTAPWLVSPTGELPAWVDLRDLGRSPAPQLWSLHGFGIRGPQFESHFCISITMWPGATNYPCLHLLHAIVLLTLWGSYESIQGHRHIFFSLPSISLLK